VSDGVCGIGWDLDGRIIMEKLMRHSGLPDSCRCNTEMKEERKGNI
jgi:hypothetical protein